MEKIMFPPHQLRQYIIQKKHKLRIENKQLERPSTHNLAELTNAFIMMFLLTFGSLPNCCRRNISSVTSFCTSKARPRRALSNSAGKKLPARRVMIRHDGQGMKRRKKRNYKYIQ